ncbi:MAG: peptidase [Candidatus Contendobacter sp.]|nr:peptidase [Candidatus Contendobacter sp.]
MAGPVVADRDHDEIHQLRQLRNAGQILSLETILANHRRQYPHGQLLEAKLEVEQGRYVYDLKLLGEDGAVREFEYDARTGELQRLEQK